MAIRKIVTVGDEKLRKHCKPVDKFNLRLRILLKDMNVDVPASETSVPLRVTLMESGVEIEQYNGMTSAGDAYSMIVPVSSSQTGPLTCRVYLNGEILLEREVTLQ